MPREDVSRYLGAGEMMPDGTPRSGLSQGMVTGMLYERLAYLRERDEARAQAEALAAEVDGLLKALQEIVDHEGEPGCDPLRIAAKAIGDLWEARNARSRSSQESSDAS